MSERYGKLFSSPKNLYTEGSPVIIAAGALLKDNQTEKVLAQLKFQSISPKKIKALTVCIQPLDTVGNPLGDTVTYQYLDLCADRDSEFGQKTPIALPNAVSRSFTVSVTEVIFTDNTTWIAKNHPWESLVNPQLLSSLRDSELEKQFRLDYGLNCANLLLEQKDLWHCVCGAVNHQDEASCHKCGKSHADMKATDIETMQTRKEERLTKEQEQSWAERFKLSKGIKVAKKASLIAIAVIVTIAVIALCNPYNWKTVLVSETYAASSSNFQSVTEYQYDLHGREKKTIRNNSYTFGIGDFLSFHTEKVIDRFSYDNSGNIQKVDGTMISESRTSGNSQSRTNHYLFICEYDDFGECICQKKLLDNGDVSIVYTYENSYDEQGRLIREIRIDHGDSSRKSTEYVYNANGQIIRKICIDHGDSSRESTEYVYNANGQMVKEIYDGKTHVEIDYEYNSLGKLIKETRIGKNTTETIYEYDSNGNLIKMEKGDSTWYYTYKTVNLFFHVCINLLGGK